MTEKRFLIDSHILIWLDTGNSRMNPDILQTLRMSEQRFLSAATAWELSLKQAAGKLKLATPVSAMMRTFGLQELPVAMRHGDRAATLPLHHRDPFDRILVAQALVEDMILVTADIRLAQYGVPLLFV